MVKIGAVLGHFTCLLWLFVSAPLEAIGIIHSRDRNKEISQETWGKKTRNAWGTPRIVIKRTGELDE